ncbi:MAG TPA: glycosyltransferase family protein [Puia sp.]|nr:glycosyltransferase family protein [Puia sp.]
MKIFYAVQATGNGHISRAMEILPYLKQYGEVDIFLSGDYSSLEMEANVRYRSKGVCFRYNDTGRIAVGKTLYGLAPLRVFREARDLPVHRYDLVVNDFDFITALACRIKKIPSINFGHHASFQSAKVPRPEKRDRVGELILTYFGRATQYLGLHFESYDDFILPPVIRKAVRQADPTDCGHTAVYLPAYSDEEIEKQLSRLDSRFEVFSRSLKQPLRKGNIQFLPVNRKSFTKSLMNCRSIIAGAGFETPAEALYLRKKMLVIPVQGQYEQQCNAAALKKLGVPVMSALKELSPEAFAKWMGERKRIQLRSEFSTQAIVSHLMYCSRNQPAAELDLCYPEWVIA